MCTGDAEADADSIYIENARKLPVPTFLATNTNFFHHVGDTAVLECAVENLGRKRVSRFTLPDRLVGLVVKASASRAEGPGFASRLRRDFFGVESDL